VHLLGSKVGYLPYHNPHPWYVTWVRCTEGCGDVGMGVTGGMQKAPWQPVDLGSCKRSNENVENFEFAIMLCLVMCK